jgi:hypothetical protein
MKNKINESLKRWFKEKWTAQDGSECGDYKGRGRVKCRPSKRVSGGTPQTWGEMSSKQKKKAVRKKQEAHRKGHQFSSHKTGKTWKAEKGKYQPSEKMEEQKYKKDIFKFLNLVEKWNPQNKKAHAACKSEVKNKFKVWPSAYASAAVVKCYKRKTGSGD